MLHYSKNASRKDSDSRRTNDSPRLPPISMNNKRFQKETFVSRSFLPPNLSPPSPSTPISFPKSSARSAKSSASSIIDDVLAIGDLVAQGGTLQGETIRLVSIGGAPSRPDDAADYEEPAKEFRVKKRLGHGSYAVVYLVQEVLFRPVPSEDGHMPTIGLMELDEKPSAYSEPRYGREYAIKCLSKANLDEEDLAAQMSEVTIHQSLRSHPNIVTLHRTLETSSFLLLLLEYVPGEDLFYFLEQARDHHEPVTPITDSPVSRTPPTPSLLSNLHPSQLLSRTRLRLISSMFAQMCDAVAACHAQQVFHRDIKPENFIVTDGWTTLPDGRQERKVIVKLTDFGLSTADLSSSDMDCGSAPYMSFECRNNIAPTYRPRAADVWSLGIVLINMLYHYNPWTDTSHDACSSFNLYRRDPVNFFMCRFTGMTRPVAEYLVNSVFCILDDPEDDSRRITASEFGAWARNIPTLLGGHSVHRSVSNNSTVGHLISSIPVSHRPSSRHPSGSASAGRTPAMQCRSLSRAPSLGPAYEKHEPSDLSIVVDQEQEDQEQEVEDHHNLDLDASRSTSTTKRRKRGARKGRGSVTPSTTSPNDDTLANLADASQSLAREISKASKSSSTRRSRSKTRKSASTRRAPDPFEPVSMYPIPLALLSPPPNATRSLSPPPPVPVIPSPPVTKKPSKWKLSFGKNNAAVSGRVSPVEEVPPPTSLDLGAPPPSMSTTASNVTSLIMGLSAPPPLSAFVPADDNRSTWGRGRHPRANYSAFDANSKSPAPRSSPSPDSREPQASTHRRGNRAVSPTSTRSGRPIPSSVSSMASGSWRNSTSTTSSAGTSTSAFTRYSNSSARSVSTAATSVSSASWRTSVKPSQPPISNHGGYAALPKNIKIMSGVPWELDQVPRGQHPNPDFGSPPVRKQRTRKPKDIKLDTISERPGHSAARKSPESPQRDASTSTTDLSSGYAKDDSDGVKKVQKGQINALAKMLSALRR
jgi:serine/threonine protein kinase